MIRLGGNEAPRRPLAAVLEWSAARLGAAVGGSALLSRRQEPVASAWGAVGSPPLEADAELAGQLQRHLFPPGRRSALARRLDLDPAQAPVLDLELTETGPDADRVGELLAGRGLSAPSLVVLRVAGRVAAVVWLGSQRDDPGARSDRLQALRRVQPLLELAATPGGHSPRPRLAARGLTRRELAVARLALTGAGNAAVGAALGISERTAKNHMGRVLAKCGVRSRTQLIALYGPGDGDEGLGPSGEGTGPME